MPETKGNSFNSVLGESTIYIVIPYFQRREGVLIKALNSVLAQTYTNWHVIISDDSSPVSARSEIEKFGKISDEKLTLIEGENGGPAVARNRALDAVPENVEFVAFLDSDDTWTEYHLENAAKALEQGFDFYFADLMQLGAKIAAFSRSGRLDSSKHANIFGHGLHSYDGDLFDQTLMGNVIGTPTVVYRYSSFPDQRFHQEYTHAGEDYLFWMELQKKGARAAFSERCEAFCGEGVNVFAGSGWGSENSLSCLVDQLSFNHRIPKLFELTDKQHETVKEKVTDIRHKIGVDILHRLSHFKPIKISLLIKMIRDDRLMMLLPYYVVRGVFRR